MTTDELMQQLREHLENGFGYLIEIEIEQLGDDECDPNADTQILPACLVEAIREKLCLEK